MSRSPAAERIGVVAKIPFKTSAEVPGQRAAHFHRHAGLPSGLADNYFAARHFVTEDPKAPPVVPQVEKIFSPKPPQSMNCLQGDSLHSLKREMNICNPQEKRLVP